MPKSTVNCLHQKWSNKLQYTSNFGSHNPTTSLRYQSLWLMILQTRASSKGRQPPFRGTPLRFGLLTSLTQLLTQQDALFNEVTLNAWIQFTDGLAKLKPSGVHGPGMTHTFLWRWREGINLTTEGENNLYPRRYGWEGPFLNDLPSF